MSLVRLLVLGVLRHLGPSHGYVIHQTMVTWKIDTWTRIKPGSIYHALKKLTAEGKLTERREHSPDGPDRTLYKLASAGEQELLVTLKEALQSFEIEALGVGLAFIEVLPRQVALDLVKDTYRRAVANRDYLSAMSREDMPPGAPHTHDLLLLWAGYLSATIKWLGDLIARLEAGDYVMEGEGSSLSP